MFAAARRGEQAALRAVDVEAARIALAIAAVAPVLDPELVILGGGIARGGGDLLLAPVARELAALSPFRPRLAITELGDEAVLHGAVSVALERRPGGDVRSAPATWREGRAWHEGHAPDQTAGAARSLCSRWRIAAAGCGGSGGAPPAPAARRARTRPVTITLWHLFGGEEAPVFEKALAGFHKQYPWITVKPIVQPNTVNDTFDPNLINAIKGGNPPDVALPFGPDYVAQYCTSGLWQDLTPYMQRDNVKISDFAPAAISYTNFGGKQCALPSLTDAYGLYYNKDLLAKAGITSPPKTMTELMDDAKKLTVRNPDGSIKVAGFVPLNEWEELGPSDLGRAVGRAVVRLERRPSARNRSGLDVGARVAEAAHRLVRLRQHREVLRHLHERRVQRQQRLPDRQGGDDVRR